MTKQNEYDELIRRVHKRFQQCVDYESYARNNYDEDIKFANGDSLNNYQWPDTIRNARIGAQNTKKPCLTINKTKVHNLAIINDAKQNKPAVTIRPVGEGATYESAQVYMDIIRHIEYRSNAENVYDGATVTQVEGGIGYWRIKTDYESPSSFNQEILICPVGDPRSVYLDPDIRQADGSDARFGYIFEDLPRDLFEELYPNHKDVGGPAIAGDYAGEWVTKDHVRVAEYFEKKQKADRLVAFFDPDGNQVIEKFSNLTPEGKKYFRSLPEEETRVRDIVSDEITWYKIAGNKVIDEKPWLGIHIPIVRVVGTETILDGRLDRFGNTRALLDPQRMYNYNASNYVEVVATQPRAPFIVPVAAIENLEEYWKTANTDNHATLPYNHIAEDGSQIPAPQRLNPPPLVPAYIQGMQMSEQQMMMASGQYQAQMGENENAKSGVAINARQRQGDRATYHFIDNLAIAIRFTGKILIDLIPKIYDTQRIVRIMGLDGSIADVMIDPNSPDAVQKRELEQQEMDKGNRVAKLVFNPNVGTYDVQSDVGPGYATRRQEAWNAFVQIASQNKDFMSIAGDLMFKVADFPMADELAQRWARSIPPNIKGDAPNPQMEQALQAASDKIEQQMQIIADLSKQLADKDKDIDIKAYNAESNRLKQIGNAGPIVDEKELKPIIQKLLSEMMNSKPIEDETEEMPMPSASPQEPVAREDMDIGDGLGDGMETPEDARLEAPLEGAQQAPDGNWYVPDEDRPGKFKMVEMAGG